MIELFQVGQVAEVERTLFQGWGQGGTENEGLRIDGLDVECGFAEEVGIGGWIHEGVAPVGAEIGLVPDLIVVHLVAVTVGKSAGEVTKVADFCWRSG